MMTVPLLGRMVLVALTLAALLLAVSAWPSLRALAGSLSITRALLAGQVAPTAAASAAQLAAQSGCPPYLETFSAIRAVQASDAPLALRLIDKLASCGDAMQARAALLAPTKGLLLDATGRYSEACTVLSAAGAQPAVLQLAQAASNRGAWAQAASYLDCLEQIRAPQGTVSGSFVAQEYYELAMHYEKAGQNDAAMVAYRRATAWSPLVWYAPLAGQARLLTLLDRRAEAYQLLLSGLAQSDEVANTFLLLRELGGMWQDDKDYSKAFCAYVQAQQLTGRLAQSMGPDRLNKDIANRIARLPQGTHSDAASCIALPTGASTSSS